MPDTEYRPSVDQDTTHLQIRQLAQAHGVQLTPNQTADLNQFVRLLSKWGQTMRLTSDPRPEVLIRQHLPDAMVIARILSHHQQDLQNALDVGSGAGLPALPLSILLPNIRFTLVESRTRRCSFLRTAIHKLKLTCCQVINSRLEDVDISRQDLALSRATFPPPKWLDIAPERVRPGGLVLLLCSSTDQVPDQTSRLQRVELTEYSLAGGTKRVTALFKCST